MINLRTQDIVDVYFSLLQGSIKIFPSAFRIWLSFKAMIIVTRADQAEKILSSNTIIDKADEYSLLKPWLNEGLLTSGGDKWRLRRKLLTPTFHFNILEEFIPIMNEQAKILTEIIQKQIRPGEFLDSVPLITNCTLDIISETAMGLKLGSQQKHNQHYVNAINRLTRTTVRRMIFPWLQNEFLFNLLTEGRNFRKDLKLAHEFTMKVIQERKREMLFKMENPLISNTTTEIKRRLVFMDLLLQQHLKQPNQFTELDIQEEVDTFMFEGHDTTAMSVIWILFMLGNNPEIQARVHEEIDAFREEFEDGEFFWNSTQLRQMKFLEACIKETLRLFPSVPAIQRIATHEVILDDGKIVIPEGVDILLFLYGIQRDPKYFTKPGHFIPDRFMEDSKFYQGKINPFAYVPFSAGPRNCIGQKFAMQEEKIILATLLSKFKVKSRLPYDKIKFQAELILRPQTTVDMEFIPRYEQF